MRQTLILSLLALVFAACSGGGDAEIATLPADWTQDGNRFWKAGVDTTALFPDLETVESMGVVHSSDDTDRRGYVQRNLQRRLVVLYRQNPRVVDSLFQARFPEWIGEENLGGELAKVVDRLERPATQSLSRSFRGPSARLTLGEDIPYAFPDSLKAAVGDARVRLQVALDADGQPLAIEVLGPVHPTLDLIAVRAATQQRWTPIYLDVRNNWVQIPGWVRYNVLFGQPGSGETP